jgi:chromosome partitioning protein
MVFETIIRRNIKLGEAPSYGKPVVMYDADSKGSVNYLNLARELLQKNNMTELDDSEKVIQVDNEEE